jgi:hypothetical protein
MKKKAQTIIITAPFMNLAFFFVQRHAYFDILLMRGSWEIN